MPTRDNVLSKIFRRWARGKHFPFFLLGAGIGAVFGLYLWNLYTQLTDAFYHEEQFVPTRIFSDVTRIAPPQTRTYIESRLQSLGYLFQPGQETLTFNLRPIDYPRYLLPENHPSLTAQALQIQLKFDGPQNRATLQSIELNDQEISDLYLEPELVATLSRTGETQKKAIRSSLKFDEIPAPVWKAIIAIEDQHFLDHKGLDPKGIARAIWVNLKTFSFAQGGSTITQQLVKNLMVRRGKNIFRKANELFLALLLEARFGKEQILERYLNEVYLGQVGGLEVHGVAEGAEHFFGKRLDELNLGEIALMAGLIRGPGFYSPYRYKDRAFERRRLVLKKMVETGQIAQAEAQSALKLPIRLTPPQAVMTKAPFFTDYVKSEMTQRLKRSMSETEIMGAGFRVYTTLDPYLNQLAQKSVTEGVLNLEKRLKLPAQYRLEGVLASVDHSTGQIKALIGGKNYGESNFNRILNMKRQIGSTFKPIVYLTAFNEGEDQAGIPYSPGHPAEDAPWTLIYDHGKQKWAPRNYEPGHLGWTSYRVALSHSINTVAAKLGYEIGPKKIANIARSLGIESDLPLVPSLSLGVAELTPLELLRVYATLANRGVQEELSVIRSINRPDGTDFIRMVYHPTQVMDPAPIDLLTDVLQDVFNQGTAQAARKLGFDRPAAGKTGTTSDYRDAWFAGYTPQLTTVVWVGMDQMSGALPAKIHLTGAVAALPIWVRYMSKALESDPVERFQDSDQLVQMEVDLHTGNIAESGCNNAQVRVEKFVRGHEPKTRSCQNHLPPSVPQTIEN